MLWMFWRALEVAEEVRKMHTEDEEATRSDEAFETEAEFELAAMYTC